MAALLHRKWLHASSKDKFVEQCKQIGVNSQFRWVGSLTSAASCARAQGIRVLQVNCLFCSPYVEASAAPRNYLDGANDCRCWFPIFLTRAFSSEIVGVLQGAAPK
jgi:hypothetical protein